MERRIEARRRQWRASARRWNDASLQQPEAEAAAAARARAVRGMAAADSVRSAVLAAASPGRFLLPPGRVHTQVAWTLLRSRLRRRSTHLVVVVPRQLSSLATTACRASGSLTPTNRLPFSGREQRALPLTLARSGEEGRRTCPTLSSARAFEESVEERRRQIRSKAQNEGARSPIEDPKAKGQHTNLFGTLKRECRASVPL